LPDFPREETLDELGIAKSSLASGFGNTDAQEAKNRIEVMEYLDSHPDFVQLINRLLCVKSIPSSEDSFCDYYDPNLEHNPFWDKLYKLFDYFDSQNVEKLPSRIKVFYETLFSFRGLEKDEKEMAKIIGELLQSTAVMEGIAKIRLYVYETESQSQKEHDKEAKMQFMITKAQKQQLFGLGYSKQRVKKMNPEEAGKILGIKLKKKQQKPKIDYIASVDDPEFIEFHGHRTFSFALSQARKKEYPKWLRTRNFWRSLFGGTIGAIIRRSIDQKNKKELRRAYEPMVIDRSGQIKDDLRKALPDYIKKNHRKILPLLVEKRSTLLIYFVYGKTGEKAEEGLKFRIYDVEQIRQSEIPFSFTFASFKGYSEKRTDLIFKARKEIKHFLEEKHFLTESVNMRMKIVGIDPKFLGTEKLVKIKSPETDRVHKWRALENLYRNSDVVKVYDAMKDFSSFVEKNCRTLVLMEKQLLKPIKERAKELNTQICFPEIITDDKSVVQFGRLYPMHLGETLKANKIVPIDNLPAINGTMIGLTGSHGGGKTVTEHTVTANVYLAQSGLPILGKSFRLNPKTHLGMVFIEGVTGKSVVQELIRKTENVFRKIDNVPGQNILLVLDELGSATQQKDGMSLAMKVLRTLKARKISFLFSTQILNVAEQARDELGAQCFKVDRKHHLSPGIAGGDLDAVLKDCGLAKYLR